MRFVVRWPEDAGRVVPLPGGEAIELVAAEPFRVRMGDVCVLSAPGGEEGALALLQLPEVDHCTETTLLLSTADETPLGGIRALLLPEEQSLSPAAPQPLADTHGVLANRRGTAVQARAAWAELHSKYDAFLAANLDTAGPGDRRVVVPCVHITFDIAGEQVALTGTLIEDFAAERQALRWKARVRGLSLRIELTLGEGNAIALVCEMLTPAPRDVLVRVRPLLDDRSFHQVTKAFAGAEHAFPERITNIADGFEFALTGDHLLRAQGTAPFATDSRWQYCVALPAEAARGLENMMDVFSAGEFAWQPHEQSRFELHVTIDDAPPAQPAVVGGSAAGSLADVLHGALDLYLADRSGECTVIAGFPWFLDWGRDSLIFTRGLIAAGRMHEAASILRRFASFEMNGTLPNLLRGSEVTNRETSDAPLWLVVAAGDLANAGGSLDAVCGTRTLRAVLRDIVRAKMVTAMDGGSGLLHSDPHHTWMDTDQPACTPREGYPIEIQALWHAALRVVALHCEDAEAAALAAKVERSIDSLFWRSDLGFFADCLHAPRGVSAHEAVADDHLRPNQWLAITLGAVPDEGKARSVLRLSQCLLVPGAARSLAPRRVEHPLHARLIVDAHHPYWARYKGAEDVTRKPAYHNGTAWCWQYPLFAEAMVKTYGPSHTSIARKLLQASTELLREGCAGQLPEILDGDAPHVQRGCGAQAWSISEWVRVWRGL